jgi:hypothetical protein
MLLKLGVDISRLADQVRRALATIDRVFQKAGEEAVITSTYEGTHGPASLHYANRAIDLRLPKADLIPELTHELGPAFDVVRESTHIHIEYDP